MAASVIANILGGNALEGAAKLIDSIKGKSPEDAAKFAQIAADTQALQMKYAAEFSAAQTDLVKSQITVNQTEASSTNVFASSWRPLIGYCCGLGLFSQFLVQPFATWVAALCHHPIVYPSLDMGTLLTLLLGMLGLGSMRTVEKVNGVGLANK